MALIPVQCLAECTVHPATFALLWFVPIVAANAWVGADAADVKLTSFFKEEPPC